MNTWVLTATCTKISLRNLPGKRLKSFSTLYVDELSSGSLGTLKSKEHINEVSIALT